MLFPMMSVRHMKMAEPITRLCKPMTDLLGLGLCEENPLVIFVDRLLDKVEPLRSSNDSQPASLLPSSRFPRTHHQLICPDSVRCSAPLGADDCGTATGSTDPSFDGPVSESTGPPLSVEKACGGEDALHHGGPAATSLPARRGLTWFCHIGIGSPNVSGQGCTRSCGDKRVKCGVPHIATMCARIPPFCAHSK